MEKQVPVPRTLRAEGKHCGIERGTVVIECECKEGLYSFTNCVLYGGKRLATDVVVREGWANVYRWLRCEECLRDHGEAGENDQAD